MATPNTPETKPARQERREIAKEPQRERRYVAPPVDVFENADEILLVADMPGLEPDSLSIELDRGELRIEARRVGGFEYRRAFTVPEYVDGDKVNAEYKHGVLHLHLAKASHVKPRKITIKAG